MRYLIKVFSKNKSLRGLIILIFTVEILFFAIITGYLSYNSGIITIKKNIYQISKTVNDDITKMLVNYLDEPGMLEQFHNTVILNKQLDFSNQTQRDKYFVETLKLYPRVTNTYICLANGNEYGARREDNGTFTVWNSDLDQKSLDYYPYDSNFGRQNYIKSLYPYDTRQRPPFLRGLELKRAGWTDVYPSATGRGLVITAVHPVYTSENELVGVLGSSILLNWIDEFLSSLYVTDHSSIFIIGTDEKIIASTDSELKKTQQEGKVEKLVNAGENCCNPLLAQSIKALKEKRPLDMIDEDIDISFYYNNEKYLLRAHPIIQKNDLDWISLILIPEKDLSYFMYDFLYQLLFITLAACFLGLISGILSARYILKPIMKVNQAAKKIAEGEFSSKITINRNDEIGQLVYSINDMSEKLEQYFDSLCMERLRNKLLTAGLETSSNLVIILDVNRAVWWCNAAYEKLSGYKLSELLGKDVAVLLSDKNNPQLLAEAKKCFVDYCEWRGEIIACRKDGNDYIDEVAVTPIFDEIGKVSYYLIVGQDITERVKAREAIQNAQETIRKAEKISSIGTMAAGISHEINQPLNSIKVISGGILYLLTQNEKISMEEMTNSIKEISDQADRISSIIKHLRSFTRKDQNKLELCDLNSSVEMAIRLVGSQLTAHRVKVTNNLEENLPRVLAVTTGLEEIIINLLVNAMQALDTIDKTNKLIAISTYFTDKVILKISDNGPGINPELGNKIFESFISTKLDGENLGLGLAIIHNIVTAYAGTIEVSRNKAGGATFTIALPAAQNEVAEEVLNENITGR